jgi:hypothetical protein
MKLIALCTVCVVLCASSLQAADLVSGTWTAGDGPDARIYVFKVVGDRFTGIMCGPCDDPGRVFRIEDGTILGTGQATFSIRYDVSRRDRVDAAIARNQMTLSVRPEARANDAPATVSLKRVVENFELSPRPLPAAPVSSKASPPSSSIEGRWVSVGRTAQQNWILKVQDGRVWGLVCGPCTPAVVAMIDEGRIDGDTITFYINHIDTPPDAARQGVQRNVMTGKISGSPNGNVMRFTWIREQAPEQTGEIVMIGPLR